MTKDKLGQPRGPAPTTRSETLPGLLMHQARTRGGEVAYRQKAFGIWRSFTWSEYLDRVRDLALGFVSLGLVRGDRVAILGDNRPEWMIAELAAQAVGGQVMGIYQDSASIEVKYLLEFSKARFVVVEDQEQVDKILEIHQALPDLRKVIYYDPKGLRGYDEPFLLEMPAVEALGRERRGREKNGREGNGVDVFERLVAKIAEDDVALLATTSGTTGKPKLAVLTHGNLLAAGRGLLRADPMLSRDEFVSFLPLAWIGEQMLSIACGLDVGFAVSFPEEPETVRDDLREIGPQVLFAPPRIWENMVSEVQVKIEDASRLKRWIYHWALGVGEAAEECRRQGENLRSGLRLRRFWAEWLCLFWLKDKLGLRRLKRAYTGGAALGPDVFRFFRALGVHFKQIYGQTEVAGLCAAHRDDDVKFQTVGHPLPSSEIRIAEDGEILVRGPAVFRGYHDNPQATTEALRDGWLHTGDAGYFDADGHLVVIDRAADVVKLGGGTVFSPQFLENKLKFSPYVKEAVVFGGGPRPWVTAMLVIDYESTGKWAERRHIAYTTFTDLAQKPEVAALLGAHVESVNQDLPEAARVHRFLLLHKQLDADDAELTRTRKVRRRVIAERYEELIEALYGEEASVTIRSAITYQDGRTSEIETRLNISDSSIAHSLEFPEGSHRKATQEGLSSAKAD